MIREEAALVRGEVGEDVIVGADNEHDVLAHNAQLLALVANIVGNVGDDELSVKLLPIVNLSEEGEELLVEVANEVAERGPKLGGLGHSGDLLD